VLDLTAAILRQSREVAALKERFFAEQADRIGECCRAMASAFDRGGRLYSLATAGVAAVGVAAAFCGQRRSTDIGWRLRYPQERR
jgi:hypothetical protein